MFLPILITEDFRIFNVAIDLRPKTLSALLLGINFSKVIICACFFHIVHERHYSLLLLHTSMQCSHIHLYSVLMHNTVIENIITCLNPALVAYALQDRNQIFVIKRNVFY